MARTAKRKPPVKAPKYTDDDIFGPSDTIAPPDPAVKRGRGRPRGSWRVPPPGAAAAPTTQAAQKKKGPAHLPPVNTRFKPGQSGNPEGARLHNPQLRAVKNMTKKELAEIGTLIVTGDIETLEEMRLRPEATVLQRMLAAVCLKVIYQGDMSAFDSLLNRLVGKVKDEVEHSGTQARVVVSLPANGREAKAG